MKKIFIVMSFVLMGVCLYVSCSQDNAESEKSADTSATVSNDYEEQFAALQLKIDELNQQTFPNWGTDNTTRGGFLNFLKKLAVIALCDAWGAFKGGVLYDGGVAGAVICGVWTSVNAASQASYTPNSTSADEQELVFQFESSSLSILDSIGLYHNEIIKAMQKENPLVFDTKYRQQNDLLKEVCIASEKYMKLESGTLSVDFLESQPTIKELVNKMPSAASNQLSPEEFLERLQKVYPEHQKELAILYNFVYYINVEGENLDTRQYTVDMLELIEQSDLPKSVKDALKVGITVGYASSNLWEYTDVDEE